MRFENHVDKKNPNSTPIPAPVQVSQSGSPVVQNSTIQRAIHNPRSLQPAEILRLQNTIGNQAVSRLIQRAGPAPAPSNSASEALSAKNNPRFHKLLANTLAASKLRSSHKRGQGAAEQAVYDNDNLVNQKGEVDKSIANTPATTDQIIRLITLNNFDKIARKDPKKMTDEEKFTVIKANQILSKDLRKGVVINKIIPESDVLPRLNNTKTYKDRKTGNLVNASNSITGSVATEKNYEGITGSESVANFGLDYGAYTDQKTKKPVDPNSKVSGYLKDTGNNKFSTVKRVYYVKVDMPDDKLENVKVPVAEELIAFANKLKAESQKFLKDTAWIKKGEVLELRLKAEEKIKIVTRFLEIAVSGKVSFSRNADGSKNTEDPLNETGMTTKGSRFMEIIGPDGIAAEDYRTINQEYYLTAALDFPQATKMYVKDEKGEDHLVAELVSVIPPKWNIVDQALLP